MGEIGNKSLVTLFDDLCHHPANSLPSLDQEFLKFISQQEVCRVRWQAAESALKNLQKEHDLALQETKQWKLHFENTKKEMLEEQKRRMDAELSLREVGELFTEVKDMVARDPRISQRTKKRFVVWHRDHYMGTVPQNEMMEHSSEFDRTVLDFSDPVSPNMGLNQTYNCPTANKRRRLIHETSNGFLATTPDYTTITINVPHVTPTSHTSIQAVPKSLLGPLVPRVLRRSNSEPEALFVVEPAAKFKQAPVSAERLERSSSTLQPLVQKERVADRLQASQFTPKSTTSSSIQFLKTSSTNKPMGHNHNFCSKTVIRPETCSQCGRRIKFSKQALKCHHCRITCHPQCKSSVPATCVPVTCTPVSKKPTLSDFAPTDRPRVPALIVHCVRELEKRAMTEVGLYRLSAPDKDIKELKRKFLKGKGVPIMGDVEVHVICAVIKDFLRNVGTLIPKLLWQDFTDATKLSDHEECLAALYQCISQLPLAHKETLAFLVLHWQRVAASPDIRMPTANLATVLGPTVVGFSSDLLEADAMMQEQTLQVKLMGSLLHIPSDFWNTITSAEGKPQRLFPNVLCNADGTEPKQLHVKASQTLSRVFSLNPGSNLGKSRFFTSPTLQ